MNYAVSDTTGVWGCEERDRLHARRNEYKLFVQCDVLSANRRKLVVWWWGRMLAPIAKKWTLDPSKVRLTRPSIRLFFIATAISYPQLLSISHSTQTQSPFKIFAAIVAPILYIWFINIANLFIQCVVG